MVGKFCFSILILVVILVTHLCYALVSVLNHAVLVLLSSTSF